MAEYLTYEKTCWRDIPEQNRPQSGVVFICLSNDHDDPFNDWDICVGIMFGERPQALGRFKTIIHAQVFAEGL